jgi:putative ABC transport system permease protein
MRNQLIMQFLSESFLVVIMAYILSIALVTNLLPWFNELAGKQISIDWTNPYFWMISISFILSTSLLAGSYPALYLSSFNPVKVLKGTFKAGRFAAIPRKILVVVQFTVSVSLIIGTIIIYQQIQFTKNRPIGYNRDGLVMIPMQLPDFYGKYDIFRNELKNTGAVVEMSESSSPITALWGTNGGFDWQGKDPNLHPEFATIWVSHDYGKTIGWDVKKGRDFSREFPTDTAGVILNEAALKFMNIEDPVGMEITWGRAKLHVVGVVKDVIMQSPYEPVKQTIYLMNYDNVNWITLRLNPQESASASLAKVESVFKKIIPSAPFDYEFVDLEFSKKFASEERVGKLASIFAVLAILISCLGLFGLASFVAAQRTKEIGIRKILGASLVNLWQMLSKDFVFLVIISCAIAIPIAYLFLNNWLQKYEYRTEISWWVFGLSIIGAMGITLLTVSYQAIKAAMMNPVNSLKTE